MALSNRDRIGRAFELLATGLELFVNSRMRAVHGGDWLESFTKPDFRSETSVTLRDPAVQLRVMAEMWDPVFRKELTRPDRTLIFELRDVRNRWAHNDAFNADDTYRALDSIERLLVAVDAKESAEVGMSKADFMRLRYEAETRKAVETSTVTSGVTAGLPPWRDVIVPHDDVAQGRYELAEFAADLDQVAKGHGVLEYADSIEFFRRTYLTEGLRHLLTEAVRRLSNVGGMPVVDLQTTFGGGKTHTLIALWHLFSGIPLNDFPQEIQDTVRKTGVGKLPDVKRAAIVGTRIPAGQAVVKPDGTKVATLWGEIAWQLGGAQAYEAVANSDRSGTSPGDALREVIAANTPCLILIDEWVAYARQLYGVEERLSGGIFDAHVSFAQSLTEAVRATEGALLVVSLPASVPEGMTVLDPESPGSNVELGGPGGSEALRRLRSVLGRIESSWRPASAEEGFEIVRRRLFKPIEAGKIKERDSVARVFADYYSRQAAEFPVECRDPAYEQRIRAAYPIHPELFDRLYQDWSTLERFQRTRGVLRFMAQVVGVLWKEGDQSPLILPGTVPLNDAPVATELARNLDDQWKPVMDTDVDSPGSLPLALDREFTNIGRYSAARKVARTVFLGSAPTVHSPHRGIEASRVRLGCAAPKEHVAIYGDALARLSDRATYLYVDHDRYWYGLSPSVSRMARDRAQRWLETRVAELDAEICKAIGHIQDKEHLAGVHVAPSSSADIEDDDQVRLVVLPPDKPHVSRSNDSPAVVYAKELLEHRGSSPRLYRNMLIFLACDQQRLDDLRQGMAEKLAWTSLSNDVEELNLAMQQANQARSKAAEADYTVLRRLAEAYKWALVPAQPDPIGSLLLDPQRIEGQRVERPDDLAARVSKRLVDKGLLYLTYAPSLLRNLVLEGHLHSLWERGHVSVNELWDCLARYPYLPRLRDREVLINAVRSGSTGDWQGEGFALADGYDETSNRYLGLAVNTRNSVVSGTTLLVKPDMAISQFEKDGREGGSPAFTPKPAGKLHSISELDTADNQDYPATVTPRVRPRRFHGSVVLRSERLIPEFGKVVQEIIQRIANTDGTDVDVTVEISATSTEGFDDSMIRTITENAHTLHFNNQGFEEA